MVVHANIHLMHIRAIVRPFVVASLRLTLVSRFEHGPNEWNPVLSLQT